MTDTVLVPPEHAAPTVFTRAQLDWLPWLEPLAVDAMTERHMASLVDAARVKSPYFRLLARDPDALEARTRTDKDIFYNPDAGLPRAERELAAAATSRFNGCLYCASVHARHAATYSKREADVQRLLDAGVTADLGERWNAIVAASVALTATPSTFGPEHVDRDRKSTRLNSSHRCISYAVFCLKKKKTTQLYAPAKNTSSAPAFIATRSSKIDKCVPVHFVVTSAPTPHCPLFTVGLHTFV